MLKENVKKIRESLERSSKNYIIFCDNAHIFYSYLNNLVWDDDNEMLIVIDVNEEAVTQFTNPLKIQILEYEVIQYMIGLHNEKSLDSLADIGMDAATIEKVKKYNRSINNFTTLYNKDVGDGSNPFLQ